MESRRRRKIRPAAGEWAIANLRVTPSAFIMRSEQRRLCAEWRLDSWDAPGRSHLYPFEPLGQGSPHVESLTSYITRLAEAHGVPPGLLLKYAICPVAGTTYRYQFGRNSAGIGSINGVGPDGEKIVDAVERLTKRDDLRHSTLLRFSKVLTRRGLLRSHRAWCPKCLEEQRREGRTVFEPLSWSLQIITSCVRHDQLLNLRCPYPDCGGRLSPLGWRMRPGHCSRCNRWLGARGPEPRSMNESIPKEEVCWHACVEMNVGEVLAATSNQLIQPEASAIAKALSVCIQTLGSGKLTAFADQVQIPKHFISAWRSGKVLPQLSELLRISTVTSIPLLGLMTDTQVHDFRQCAERETVWLPSRGKRTLFRSARIRASLLRYLTYSTHPSLTVIAHRVGHSTQTLRTHFPKLCRQISERHAAGLRADRKLTQQRLREATRRAVLRMVNLGVYPSSRQLALMLGNRGYRRNVHVIAEWKKTMRASFIRAESRRAHVEIRPARRRR